MARVPLSLVTFSVWDLRPISQSATETSIHHSHALVTTLLGCSAAPTATMATCVWSTVRRTTREQWRCATMVSGATSGRLGGVRRTLASSAHCLATLQMVSNVHTHTLTHPHTHTHTQTYMYVNVVRPLPEQHLISPNNTHFNSVLDIASPNFSRPYCANWVLLWQDGRSDPHIRSNLHRAGDLPTGMLLRGPLRARRQGPDLPRQQLCRWRHLRCHRHL